MSRLPGQPELLLIGGPGEGRYARPDRSGRVVWASDYDPYFTALAWSSDPAGGTRLDQYFVREYAGTPKGRVRYLVWEHLDHVNAADILARASVLDA